MNLSIFSLKDRVAIVTGGGTGIGKAIALGYADAGAHVVLASRTVANIESAAAEIRGKGRKSLAVPTDVRRSEQVTNLLQKTLEEFGRIDILVNNAGGTFLADIQDISEGGWDAVLRENLNSVFLCSKIIGGRMVEQKEGKIINISSLGGLAAWPRASHYAVAKAGTISLTKSLAVDWARYNVRVNTIAPGYMDTAGITKHKAKVYSLSRIPLGRFGKPEDIVGAAIFLASPASDYITGQTIIVDGGLMVTTIMMSITPVQVEEGKA